MTDPIAYTVLITDQLAALNAGTFQEFAEERCRQPPRNPDSASPRSSIFRIRVS